MQKNTASYDREKKMIRIAKKRLRRKLKLFFRLTWRIVSVGCVLLVIINILQGRKEETSTERKEFPFTSIEDTGMIEGAQASEERNLVLVNQNNPLPEDYDTELWYYNNEIPIDRTIYNLLDSMIMAAGREGKVLWLSSGYRNEQTQERLLREKVEKLKKDQYLTEEEARKKALKSIAAPGYSEHHTGLAVDFNGVNYQFEETEEYQWLSEHAWEYGFVQRYPRGKSEVTGIVNEPWHYRYVGREHAEQMNRRGLCLEEYLENF